MNRFVQPDTIIPSPANPQSWNRYSNVTNNPINYRDPTGHAQENDDDGGDYDPNYCDTHPSDCDDSGDPEQDLKPEITVPDPEDLRCRGLLTCDDLSLSEYAESLLPFRNSEACYFLFHDDRLCKAEYPPLSPPVLGYDWSQIDGVEMVVDIAGLITDGGTILAPPLAPKLQSIGFVIDLMAANYSVYTATNGENSLNDKVGDIGFQLLKQHPVLIARLGRAAPGVGFVGNLFSIGANLGDGLYIKMQTTIYPPDTRHAPQSP